MTVAVVHEREALLCDHCGKEFKNAAGLGAHTSRIHGTHRDGTPVEGEVVDVTFSLGRRAIDVKMARSEARKILEGFPEDVLNAFMG